MLMGTSEMFYRIFLRVVPAKGIYSSTPTPMCHWLRVSPVSRHFTYALGKGCTLVPKAIEKAQ